MSDEAKRWLTEPGVAARLKSGRAVPMAKRLRKQMTPAEKALWAVLRRIAPEEAHFRKQAPNRAVHLRLCESCGETRRRARRRRAQCSCVAIRDVERRAWIEGPGYEVLTFRNEQVLKDAETVAKHVAAVASARLR
jgi:very-short-patch-repair endonuclease